MDVVDFVKLPNGVNAALDRPISNVLQHEVVEGVDGNGHIEYFVAIKARDDDPNTPSLDHHSGEVKKFQDVEFLNDFLRRTCKVDFKTPAEAKGWSEESGVIFKRGGHEVAEDWEEACAFASQEPLLIPERPMFMVDSDAFSYSASERPLSFDERSSRRNLMLFICSDYSAQEYKKRIESGMSQEESMQKCLAESNEALDEYSAFMNGEQYGIVELKFNERGECTQTEETWGYIGSRGRDDVDAAFKFVSENYAEEQNADAAYFELKSPPKFGA